MMKATFLPLALVACVSCAPRDKTPESPAPTASEAEQPEQAEATRQYPTVLNAPTPDWSVAEFAPKRGAAPAVKREARGTAPAQSEASQTVDRWVERLNRRNWAYAWTNSPQYSISTRASEADFDEWLAANGWSAPDWIEWTFMPDLPIGKVSDEAAERVRYFASSSQRTGIQRTALIGGKLILRDGCLHVVHDQGDEDLAWFHAETGLAVDSAGYLVTVDRRTGTITARIGEEVSSGGPQGVPPNDPGIAKLREACGDGDIYNIGNPESRDRFKKRIR